MTAPRIVSLVPSATETVHALGLGECLVGRSHACDYPPEVLALPACTSTRLDPSAPGAVIDQEVKRARSEGRSLYRLDEVLLHSLRPDVLLTQGQCEVCAVSADTVQRLLDTWPGTRPRVISSSPQRLPEVWVAMQELAAGLGVPERGGPLLKTLKNRVADVILQAAALRHRPTVACLEWLDPPMAAGNWVPELVELAGGTNLFGEAGRHSPWLAWEELVRQDPEVLVLLPCGFDLPRVEQELPVLKKLPGWPDVRAVRSGRVALTDGSGLFNRPGPRVVDSLEILAEILHPKILRFGHRGRDWKPGAN